MDLDNFSLEEIIMAAIKSETDSNTLYSTLAKRTKNGILQDKLLFLAKEELKHKQVMEEVYKKHFPGQTIQLPKKSPVPLPEVTITDEDVPTSRILRDAMKAEQAAYEFYQALSKRFSDDTKQKNILLYFADMEMSHYKILEIEKESMERFEEADEYWPMIHAGP